ncbi:uncharacterized protein LOC103312924 isoform X1 [Tribolium castaneum]|uniref:Secreted protein n=1 Tax=Tribolium castaneum TaxID=7070 RepID=D6WJ32_TRICA|nr:PREDICTED: uncharacterized protein LOC103312924 isoform X1 [Tribolium castaneum]EFA03875.1 hypothetical protein TcasGA2_TC013999 [Tribolium castaneum]|eukprot:XP_008193016.1 PREDICTED: uncharacterized protein LOC103312924 isoform X1 [Tribolium castaneum]
MPSSAPYAPLFAFLLVSSVRCDVVRPRRQGLHPHEADDPNFAVRRCIKCESYDACVKKEEWVFMQCAKETIASLPFGQNEKIFRIASHPDLNDTSKSTHCAIIQWPKSEIRGCVPENINETLFCNYFAKKTGVNLSLCSTCPADVKPCNDEEPPREDRAELRAKHNVGFLCVCTALAILIR